QKSMEMTLRWAKRSKEYFEAHKEEVPWFRCSPFAVRHSPEEHVGERPNAIREHCPDAQQKQVLRSAQDDKFGGDEKKLQVPRFARDDNPEEQDGKLEMNDPTHSQGRNEWGTRRSGEERMAN